MPNATPSNASRAAAIASRWTYSLTTCEEGEASERAWMIGSAIAAASPPRTATAAIPDESVGSGLGTKGPAIGRPGPGGDGSRAGGPQNAEQHGEEHRGVHRGEGVGGLAWRVMCAEGSAVGKRCQGSDRQDGQARAPQDSVMPHPRKLRAHRRRRACHCNCRTGHGGRCIGWQPNDQAHDARNGSWPKATMWLLSEAQQKPSANGRS
jgi:hypothetical protein